MGSEVSRSVLMYEVGDTCGWWGGDRKMDARSLGGMTSLYASILQWGHFCSRQVKGSRVGIQLAVGFLSLFHSVPFPSSGFCPVPRLAAFLPVVCVCV